MITDKDLVHLRTAIDAARAARDKGNQPYGAALVSGEGVVLLTAENTQVASRDPTGHAETNLVRKTGRFDAARLRASTLYASGEPCAMCAGAIYNAGIGRVVFALGRARLQAFSKRADDIGIGAVTLLAFARPPVVVEGPALEDEAAAVFDPG